MARKKDADQPETETVVRLISPSKLKSLLNSTLKAKEDCAEITGALGEEVKTAIDKHNLHRKAYNAIKGIYNWSPEQLREFKDHFDAYWEMSGLEKKADSAPRLPMNDDVEDNVHHLQAGAAAE